MTIRYSSAFLPSLLCLLLAGCAGPSQFVPAPPSGTPPDSLAYPHPEKRVLLLYNHGSRPDYLPDACSPNGQTTPEVVKALSGRTVRGMEVVVYGVCSDVPSDDAEEATPGAEIKLLRRAGRIENVVSAFLANGVPPEHVFLVGHSAGGWASLLVARRNRVPVNAAIAFAPAFAGPKASRSRGWRVLHEQQASYLSQADTLPALVFAFEGDEYNAPEDLAFLGRIPGVRLLRLSDRVIGGVRCQRPDGHLTVFRDCFSRTQTETILDFLAERLAAARGRSSRDRAASETRSAY